MDIYLRPVQTGSDLTLTDPTTQDQQQGDPDGDTRLRMLMGLGM